MPPDEPVVGRHCPKSFPPDPNRVDHQPHRPRPRLSLPTNLAVVAGETVIVPVNIDTAKPDGSTGMDEAVLALKYNPQVFTVSSADVQAGIAPK